MTIRKKKSKILKRKALKEEKDKRTIITDWRAKNREKYNLYNKLWARNKAMKTKKDTLIKAPGLITNLATGKVRSCLGPEEEKIKKLKKDARREKGKAVTLPWKE